MATYTENYSLQGVGINARLGVILKASDQFRAGLSVATLLFIWVARNNYRPHVYRS